MKAWGFTLFLSLIALTQGRFLSSRIVNGQDAKLGEIPYQVSLQTSYHFCGGSIVNESWVVTAAHCVSGQSANRVKVLVGSISLQEGKSYHQAQKLVVHENYDPYNIVNDVALIKVATPFKFSNNVKPVTLPVQGFQVKTNSSATVSGWGSLLSSGGPAPDILQKANIYIADPSYCEKVMKESGYKIYPTNVCANDPTQRRGQCNGDSGGPLTVDGTLTGIVSWSIKDPYCASTRYPGVYTRVSEYVDWIKKNMK